MHARLGWSKIGRARILGMDDRTGSGGMRRSPIRYVSISMGIGQKDSIHRYRGVGDVIIFLCAVHAHDGPWIWVE